MVPELIDWYFFKYTIFRCDIGGINVARITTIFENISLCKNDIENLFSIFCFVQYYWFEYCDFWADVAIGCSDIDADKFDKGGVFEYVFGDEEGEGNLKIS
jgi:hypothetical protein